MHFIYKMRNFNSTVELIKFNIYNKLLTRISKSNLTIEIKNSVK